MKRFVLVALALVALVPTAAKADLLQYALPQELLDFIAAAPAADDLLAGEGKIFNGDQMHVNALSGPTGQDARGQFFYRLGSGEGEVHGRILCLEVTGNVAITTWNAPPTRSSSMREEKSHS